MRCYGITGCLLHMLAVLMAVASGLANLQIRANNYADNTSIYTQAIEDWSLNTWTEFYWTKDIC